MNTTGEVPRADAAHRRKVQRALDDLLAVCRDLADRRAPDGFYEAPDPVPYGDTLGLANTGRNQVVWPLEAALTQARLAIDEALEGAQADKQRQYTRTDTDAAA